MPSASLLFLFRLYSSTGQHFELRAFEEHGDSKLLSEFLWPVNGNTDNNLESYMLKTAKINVSLIYRGNDFLMLLSRHTESTAQ
jgi:hypothetical protein